MQALTEEQFKAALPSNMKRDINPMLIMRINNVIDNETEWEVFRENLLSFTHILQEGKFKMSQYINAVRYVGYKVMGYTNKDAYAKTFPEKIEEFSRRNISAKDISSYTTAYNKSKLVNLIFEQTLIPTHILNAPIFQRAINVQMEIMLDDKVSAKVRSDAANSLLTHLKAPETKKMELDIGIKPGGIIDEYQAAMKMMVEKQQELIRQGGDVKTITNARIKHDSGEDIIDIG